VISPRPFSIQPKLSSLLMREMHITDIMTQSILV
jgi:hypothetical protein